jgi:hypothetical protein
MANGAREIRIENIVTSINEIPPDRRLPFETIREPLDSLLVATANKLERELRIRPIVISPSTPS